MGLRDKVALVLVTGVIAQITIGYCMPSTTRKATLRRYLDSFKQAKTNPAPRSPVPTKGYKTTTKPVFPKYKNGKVNNETPSEKSMYKVYNFPDTEYPLETSPRDRFYLNTIFSSNPFDLPNNKITPQSETINNLKKEMRMKRKMNKFCQNAHDHTNSDMPSFKAFSTAPEFTCLKGHEAFPEVQYPINAMETWGPHYWKATLFNPYEKKVSEFPIYDPKASEKMTIFYKPHKQKFVSKQKQYMEQVEKITGKMRGTTSQLNTGVLIIKKNSTTHNEILGDLIKPDLNASNVLPVITESTVSNETQLISTTIGNDEDLISTITSNNNEPEDTCLPRETNVTTVSITDYKEPVITSNESESPPIALVPILYNLEQNGICPIDEYNEEENKNNELIDLTNTLDSINKRNILHPLETNQTVNETNSPCHDDNSNNGNASSEIIQLQIVEALSDSISREVLLEDTILHSEDSTTDTGTMMSENNTLITPEYYDMEDDSKASGPYNVQLPIPLDITKDITSDNTPIEKIKPTPDTKIPYTSLFVIPVGSSVSQIQLPIIDSNSGAPIIVIVPTIPTGEKLTASSTYTTNETPSSILEIAKNTIDDPNQMKDIVCDVCSNIHETPKEYILETPSTDMGNWESLLPNFEMLPNNSLCYVCTEAENKYLGSNKEQEEIILIGNNISQMKNTNDFSSLSDIIAECAPDKRQAETSVMDFEKNITSVPEYRSNKETLSSKSNDELPEEQIKIIPSDIVMNNDIFIPHNTNQPEYPYVDTPEYKSNMGQREIAPADSVNTPLIQNMNSQPITQDMSLTSTSITDSFSNPELNKEQPKPTKHVTLTDNTRVPQNTHPPNALIFDHSIGTNKAQGEAQETPLFDESTGTVTIQTEAVPTNIDILSSTPVFHHMHVSEATLPDYPTYIPKEQAQNSELDKTLARHHINSPETSVSENLSNSELNPGQPKLADVFTIKEKISEPTSMYTPESSLSDHFGEEINKPQIQYAVLSNKHDELAIQEIISREASLSDKSINHEPEKLQHETESAVFSKDNLPVLLTHGSETLPSDHYLQIPIKVQAESTNSNNAPNLHNKNSVKVTVKEPSPRPGGTYTPETLISDLMEVTNRAQAESARTNFIKDGIFAPLEMISHELGPSVTSIVSEQKNVLFQPTRQLTHALEPQFFYQPMHGPSKGQHKNMDLNTTPAHEDDSSSKTLLSGYYTDIELNQKQPVASAAIIVKDNTTERQRMYLAEMALPNSSIKEVNNKAHTESDTIEKNNVPVMQTNMFGEDPFLESSRDFRSKNLPVQPAFIITAKDNTPAQQITHPADISLTENYSYELSNKGQTKTNDKYHIIATQYTNAPEASRSDISMDSKVNMDQAKPAVAITVTNNVPAPQDTRLEALIQDHSKVKPVYTDISKDDVITTQERNASKTKLPYNSTGFDSKKEQAEITADASMRKQASKYSNLSGTPSSGHSIHELNNDPVFTDKLPSNKAAHHNIGSFDNIYSEFKKGQINSVLVNPVKIDESVSQVRYAPETSIAGYYYTDQGKKERDISESTGNVKTDKPVHEYTKQPTNTLTGKLNMAYTDTALTSVKNAKSVPNTSNLSETSMLEKSTDHLSYDGFTDISKKAAAAYAGYTKSYTSTSDTIYQPELLLLDPIVSELDKPGTETVTAIDKNDLSANQLNNSPKHLLPHHSTGISKEKQGHSSSVHILKNDTHVTISTTLPISPSHNKNSPHERDKSAHIPVTSKAETVPDSMVKKDTPILKNMNLSQKTHIDSKIGSRSNKGLADTGPMNIVKTSHNTNSPQISLLDCYTNKSGEQLAGTVNDNISLPEDMTHKTTLGPNNNFTGNPDSTATNNNQNEKNIQQGKNKPLETSLLKNNISSTPADTSPNNSVRANTPLHEDVNVVGDTNLLDISSLNKFMHKPNERLVGVLDDIYLPQDSDQLKKTIAVQIKDTPNEMHAVTTSGSSVRQDISAFKDANAQETSLFNNDKSNERKTENPLINDTSTRHDMNLLKSQKQDKFTDSLKESHQGDVAPGFAFGKDTLAVQDVNLQETSLTDKPKEERTGIAPDTHDIFFNPVSNIPTSLIQDSYPDTPNERHYTDRPNERQAEVSSHIPAFQEAKPLDVLVLSYSDDLYTNLDDSAPDTVIDYTSSHQFTNLSEDLIAYRSPDKLVESSANHVRKDHNYIESKTEQTVGTAPAALHISGPQNEKFIESTVSNFLKYDLSIPKDMNQPEPALFDKDIDKSIKSQTEKESMDINENNAHVPHDTNLSETLFLDPSMDLRKTDNVKNDIPALNHLNLPERLLSNDSSEFEPNNRRYKPVQTDTNNNPSKSLIARLPETLVSIDDAKSVKIEQAETGFPKLIKNNIPAHRTINTAGNTILYNFTEKPQPAKILTTTTSTNMIQNYLLLDNTDEINKKLGEITPDIVYNEASLPQHTNLPESSLPDSHSDVPSDEEVKTEFFNADENNTLSIQDLPITLLANTAEFEQNNGLTETTQADALENYKISMQRTTHPSASKKGHVTSPDKAFIDAVENNTPQVTNLPITTPADNFTASGLNEELTGRQTTDTPHKNNIYAQQNTYPSVATLLENFSNKQNVESEKCASQTRIPLESLLIDSSTDSQLNERPSEIASISNVENDKPAPQISDPSEFSVSKTTPDTTNESPESFVATVKDNTCSLEMPITENCPEEVNKVAAETVYIDTIKDKTPALQDTNPTETSSADNVKFDTAEFQHTDPLETTPVDFINPNLNASNEAKISETSLPDNYEDEHHEKSVSTASVDITKCNTMESIDPRLLKKTITDNFMNELRIHMGHSETAPIDLILESECPHPELKTLETSLPDASSNNPAENVPDDVKTHICHNIPKTSLIGNSMTDTEPTLTVVTDKPLSQYLKITETSIPVYSIDERGQVKSAPIVNVKNDLFTSQETKSLQTSFPTSKDPSAITVSIDTAKNNNSYLLEISHSDISMELENNKENKLIISPDIIENNAFLYTLEPTEIIIPDDSTAKAYPLDILLPENKSDSEVNERSPEIITGDIVNHDTPISNNDYLPEALLPNNILYKPYSGQNKTSLTDSVNDNIFQWGSFNVSDPGTDSDYSIDSKVIKESVETAPTDTATASLTVDTILLGSSVGYGQEKGHIEPAVTDLPNDTLVGKCKIQPETTTTANSIGYRLNNGQIEPAADNDPNNYFVQNKTSIFNSTEHTETSATDYPFESLPIIESNVPARDRKKHSEFLEEIGLLEFALNENAKGPKLNNALLDLTPTENIKNDTPGQSIETSMSNNSMYPLLSNSPSEMSLPKAVRNDILVPKDTNLIENPEFSASTEITTEFPDLFYIDGLENYTELPKYQGITETINTVVPIISEGEKLMPVDMELPTSSLIQNMSRSELDEGLTNALMTDKLEDDELILLPNNIKVLQADTELEETTNTAISKSGKILPKSMVLPISLLSSNMKKSELHKRLASAILTNILKKDRTSPVDTKSPEALLTDNTKNPILHNDAVEAEQEDVIRNDKIVSVAKNAPEISMVDDTNSQRPPPKQRKSKLIKLVFDTYTSKSKICDRQKPSDTETPIVSTDDNPFRVDITLPIASKTDEGLQDATLPESINPLEVQETLSIEDNKDIAHEGDAPDPLDFDISTDSTSLMGKMQRDTEHFDKNDMLKNKAIKYCPAIDTVSHYSLMPIIRSVMSTRRTKRY